MSDDKDQWKQTSGLAADSTVAQIVCEEPHKQEWDDEAEEKGYRSTSKYLYELVQEARATGSKAISHTIRVRSR